MSLEEARAAAQVRALRYRPRLRPRSIAAMLRDFARGGASFSELGRRYGVSAATVSYHVKKAGR